MASRSQHEIVLEPKPDQSYDDMPDVFVGRLPLVYWNSTTRRPDVAELDISAPPPFAAGDERRMWADLTESALPIPRSVLAQGRVVGGRIERLRSDQLELENVRTALVSALSMLRKWPTSETTTRIWRPIEARGSREDARFTEQFGQRVAGRTSPAGVATLDRTARRRAQMHPWRSLQLSNLAEALAQALDGHAVAARLGEDAALYGSRMLRQVAAAARPIARAVDPPMSSWPPVARAAFRAMTRAFVDIESRPDDAVSSVPLSRLWLLYESWVSAAVLRELQEMLGEPTQYPQPMLGEWGAVWEIDGRRVELLIQPIFGAKPRNLGLALSASCRSLTSDLIPDVVVAVTDPGQSRPTLSVIDAKKRGVGTAMAPADVAEAASKYLWGIRWAAASGHEAPQAISHALIVSSAAVPKMHSQAGLIDAVELRPGLPSGAALFSNYLEQLLSSTT